jgi:hypothetical protein
MMKTALILALAAPLLAHAADWENISDAVTSKVKPGAGGPTTGVVVDRISGDVFMVVSDQGLWKSTDHGATFARVDGGSIGGRCWTGWSLQADSKGQRFFCFMIFGNSGMTPDAGKTWMKSAISHLDFGGVDWEDTGNRVLAMRHDSGGMLATSADGGATWIDLQKGFTGCGVFDHQTFLVTRTKDRGIFRSGDAGATWIRVCSDTPTATTPVIFKGVAYWSAGKGILVSKDKGMTWDWLGAPVDAIYGPYFGENELHFVVVGPKGFQETKDGGKTFQQVAPLPPGFSNSYLGPSYAWDPKADIFYASSTAKPTYKLQR